MRLARGNLALNDAGNGERLTATACVRHSPFPKTRSAVVAAMVDIPP